MWQTVTSNVIRLKPGSSRDHALHTTSRQSKNSAMNGQRSLRPLTDGKKAMGEPLIRASNTKPRSEAERAASVEHTRQGLINWLQDRRERLGQTDRDIRESPEAVLRKLTHTAEQEAQELRDQQQKLLDDYIQNTASDHTM